MEETTIWKDSKTLLPGFQPKLISIGKNRQVISFDSHLPDSKTKASTKSPVIFLHGFPDNVFSFRLVAPILVKSGSRCILLSCPGYDYLSKSAKVDGSLGVEAVAKDYTIAIDNILGSTDSESKPMYHLVGHDWGALHASYIASKIHTRRVISLCLAAVPHGLHAGYKKFPKQQIIDKSWYLAFFQLPYLPEWWLLGPMDGLSLLWRQWSPNYEVDQFYLFSVRRTLSQPGIIKSALNMYRDTIGKTFVLQYILLRLLCLIRFFLGLGNRPLDFSNQPKSSDELEEDSIIFNMPVLGISGAKDGCIDTNLFDHHMSEDNDRVYPRGYTIFRIPEVGHFSFSEKPTLIANKLREIMDESETIASDIQKTEFLKADYFVVGAGATGIAFVDTILTENKDCRIVLVDRYKIPGGHWTVAYPFARLHQPASAYGVNSKRLGKTDYMDPSNLASKDEILDYYKEVLDDFIRTGRVRYFPECDADMDNSTFKSLTNENLCYKVLATTTVDSTYTNVIVPSMRPPSFKIKDSTAIVAPINDVTNLAKTYPTADFVIAGAGKTGIDAILELFRLGIASSQIVWIIPNDSWFINRDYFRPKTWASDLCDFVTFLNESKSCEETFVKMEKTGFSGYIRLDTNIMPKLFKGATVSSIEMSKLRSISRTVRVGRIVAIENEYLILEKGKLPLTKGSCVIDCTANGLPPSQPIPIFSGNRITLQTIQVFQPVFSASIIAYVLIHVADDKKRNEICTVASHPVELEEYVHQLYNSLMVNNRMQSNGYGNFINKNRLNIVTGVSPLRVLWAALGPQGLIRKFNIFLERVKNDEYKSSSE